MIFKGPPFKMSLRNLSTKHLKFSIQQSTHDSVQDAVAAMRLVRLKIEKGPLFAAVLTEYTNIIPQFNKQYNVKK